MTNYERTPIVIIGTTPRCGSTLFCSLLSEKTGLPVFKEPWQYEMINDDIKYKSYLDYKKQRQFSDRYIVKFWIEQLDFRSPYREDIKKGYKILLARKDIVSQIASWYIAECRKKWHTLPNEQEKDYVVHINKHNISRLIHTVSRSQFYSENCNIFDSKVYYEDLKLDSLAEYHMRKTKQPKNLEELKQEIKNQLNEEIPFHWKNSFHFDVIQEEFKVTIL